MTGKSAIINIRVDKEQKERLELLSSETNFKLPEHFRIWLDETLDDLSLENDPELRKLKQQVRKLNITYSENEKTINNLTFENKCIKANVKSLMELINNISESKKTKDVNKDGKK